MFKKPAASYLLVALTAIGAASVASHAHAQTPAAQQTNAVVAQAHQTAKHDRERKHAHSVRHHRQHHGKFWQGLELTETQRDEIFRIRHEQAPVLRQHHKEVRRARIGLSELSRAEKFDETAAVALTNDLGKAQAQIALMHARARAQMTAVLTPEQREKIGKRQAKKRAQRGVTRDSSNKAPAASL